MWQNVITNVHCMLANKCFIAFELSVQRYESESYNIVKSALIYLHALLKIITK